MKKKIFILVVFLFSLFVLVGCGEPVEGPQGPAGAKGAEGKSAYEVAVDNGFTGTEEQWLKSLKGKDGIDGDNGKDGKDGQDGTPAKQLKIFVEDGGFYWCYEGEEDKAILLDYYLDYVTVSYAYRPDFTYESLVAELKAAGAPTSEWDNTKASGFFEAHPEYDWLLRYFAATNPALTEFVEHYLANGKDLTGLGQYIQRPYESGPEAAKDSEANYALSTEIAGFLAGDDGEGGIAVWSGVWKPANYDAETDGGKANLALLASFNEVVVYSEQVKRNAVKDFEPMSVVAADSDSEALAQAKAAIAAWVGETHEFDCWTDAEGEEVEKGIANHSTTLYAAKYEKISVTLKAGAGFWNEDIVAVLPTILADFLADFNASEYKLEADVTTIKDLCKQDNKEKVHDFLAADGKSETPKWNWLTRYLASLNSYKAEMQGLANKTAVPGTYVDTAWQTAYEIFNFFATKCWKTEYSGEPTPNDREIQFWKNGYVNISDYLPAKYAPEASTPLTNYMVAKGLPQVTSLAGRQLGWYLEGDETQALVAAEDMVMGGVYVAKFVTDEQVAAANALINAFLADVSEALDKTHTGTSLYSQYRSSDNNLDSTGKNFMAVKLVDGAYVKAGDMATHGDVILKHAFIFEYIAQVMNSEKWLGASKHKCENTVLQAYGITLPEGVRVADPASDAPDKYYSRYVTCQLVALINHTVTNTDSSSYPCVDFSDPALWCVGLLEYKAAYDAAHPAA